MRNDGGGRDLAVLVVPLVGSVTATGDVFRPFRLLDVDGSDVGVFLPDESSERLRGTALSGCGLVRMGVSALRNSV